jgi:hypothetical protein
MSPFSGAPFLWSEKRSRDPSRQVIVISHIAIDASVDDSGRAAGSGEGGFGRPAVDSA